MYEWDEAKNQLNIEKHGVSFENAQKVFADPNRVTMFDEGHSITEDRYHCVGRVNGDILTVRFVIRNGHIRIIGAGYWRKGRKIYENNN
jgi:uncharacterized DUF497 family protein